MRPWMFAITLAVATFVCRSTDGQDLTEEIRNSAQSLHALIVVVGEVSPTEKRFPGRPESRVPANFLNKLSQRQHLVHALHIAGDRADAQLLDEVRSAAHANDLGGRVTISEYKPNQLPLTLPFPTRTVNALVWLESDALSPVVLKECLRTLQPMGVLWVKPPWNDKLNTAVERMEGLGDASAETHSSGWLKLTKHRSAKLGTWSHPRHDASRNAVSQDQEVASPRGVRWSGGPLWPRGYRRSAVPAVTVGPRQMVYVLQDEVAEESLDSVPPEGAYPPERADPPEGADPPASSSSSGKLIKRDTLVARDAFNGLPLWKRNAASHMIVTHGERIFTTHDNQPVEISARTGEVIRVFPTETPRELAVVGNMLLVRAAKSLSAWSLKTAEEQWRIAASADRMLADDSQGATKQRVYFTINKSRRGEGSELLAVDLTTGNVVWRQLTDPWNLGSLYLVLVSDGVVILGSNDGNHAVSTEDGSRLWSYAYERIGHGGSYEKVLAVDQMIWVHAARTQAVNRPGWIGLDPKTGSAIRRLTQPNDFRSKHRCSYDVATGNWLLCGTMDFTNLQNGAYEHFGAARNSCAAAGVVPANGLVYSFPHACGCYPMLRGLLALDSDSPSPVDGTPLDKQLMQAGSVVRGPAWGDTTGFAPKPDAVEWTTYRGTPARTAATTVEGPQKLSVAWRHSIARWDNHDELSREWQIRDSDPVSPAVQSQGRCYVADAEGHRLLALDSESGKLLWEYFAGARIEGPPTVTGPWCVFGTRDGSAHAVRASDGQLAWSRPLISGNRFIVSHGQLEAGEPVRGASLVVDNTMMLVTGRHQDAGRGLWVHALDVRTGSVQWQRRATGHGGVPDVLASASGATVNAKSVVKMGDWSGDVQWRPGDSPATPIRSSSELREMIRGGRLGLQDNSWYQRPIAMRKNLQEWTAGKDLSGQLICWNERYRIGYRASQKVLGVNGMLFGKAEIHGVVNYFGTKDADGAWTVSFDNASRVSGMVLAGKSLYVAGEFRSTLFSPRRTEVRRFDASTGQLLEALPLPARPVHDGLIADRGMLFVSLINGELIAVGEAR